MFEIKVEAQFKADYKRTMRIHPQLKPSLRRQSQSLQLAARFPRNMAPMSFQARAAITTATSISIYPMGWSMWSFCTCRIRLIL